MSATRLEAEAEVSGWSDAQLVRAGSAGDRSVFAELYRRHAQVARQVARGVAGTDEDAADAAAEAFTCVFDAIVSGRAPSMDFRPYLIVATRNAAIDQRRRSQRRASRQSGDSQALDSDASGDGRTDRPGPSETLTASEDSKLVTAAFQGLPARWQSVLWLTEVEGVPAREAADVLGLSANNVAQLAVRARARLRERYLQAHVRNHALPQCQRTVDQLGAYLAGTLADGRRARVEEHLHGCPACRERLAEVDDLGVSLRRSLIPVPLLALGWLPRLRRRLRRISASPAGDAPGVAGWGRTPAARATVAASKSRLFQTLASVPVSAVVIGVVAVAATARLALRGVIALMAAVFLSTGIGPTHEGPVAVAVGSPVQPAPTTIVAPSPPVAVAPPPPPVAEAVDPGPLPATAHPSTIVAQASSSTIDVFEPDHVTIERSLVNEQQSGAPLLFLVVDQQGDWLKVLLPIRPNGSNGWVRRQDVLLSTHTFSIVVELSAHRITVFNGTDPFLSEPVGVGTAKTPTPDGLYYTRELIEENPGGPYGPYAFGLSAFSDVLTQFGGGDGVIGLHGTNEPGALGSDVSHGCIRMSNQGITSLARTLPLGVPVDIRA